MSKRKGILLNNARLGPFPMHRLRHVGKPTTIITDEVKRIDSREIAMDKASRGDYGPTIKQAARVILPLRHSISAAQFDVIQHLGALKDNEIATSKGPGLDNPSVLSRHVKRLGYFLKADIMGICRLPPSAIYTHDPKGNPIDLNYKFAIVIVVRKEIETMKASDGHDWICDPLSFQAYQRSALIAATMANYIRRLGYPASAQHAGHYQVLMPPLLLWSGIGELSRAGIILNPFIGMASKAAAVLTDLPVEPDTPIDFGLQDFCRQCKLCAELCPSKAISSGDKVMYNGYRTWKLNEKRCASYAMLNKNGAMCNTCVKVCPWSNPNTLPHNMIRWSVQHSALARRVAIKASYLIKSEKAEEHNKWWFDY